MQRRMFELQMEVERAKADAEAARSFMEEMLNSQETPMTELWRKRFEAEARKTGVAKAKAFYPM